MGGKKNKLKLIILTTVVMGFIGVHHGAGAADGQQQPDQATAGKSSASLTRTRWQLVEMTGEPAPVGVKQKPIKMVLIHNCKDFRARGFSGCNRFSTTYKQSSGQLSFKMPAAGRKECKGFMELEAAFLAALTGTEQYRINGQTMTLFNSEEQPALLFKAIAK